MNQVITDTITVKIPSETATLKKVIMCFANPMSVFSLVRYGAIDKAAIYQFWYNKASLFYNIEKVRQQQQAFMEVMKANGVEVLLADEIPDCASQHYTRDIGFAIDNTFFCANPRRYYRKREMEGLRNLLPLFSKVVHLESGTIEGGDVIVDEQYIIVGLGEETDQEGVDCLRKKLKELKIEREVVTLEFTHRGIIHLDTKFNTPAKGIGLIHPKSFKPKSLKWLENHFDLIEATDEEAANIEINTFTISPQKVVMLERSKRLASLLESKGIETILVDYSEVTKLPGSFRCTTLPIERI
ncbi:dimethylarginine dimethylaminohydrolase family protein [Scytonema sp. NUACC21]